MTNYNTKKSSGFMTRYRKYCLPYVEKIPMERLQGVLEILVKIFDVDAGIIAFFKPDDKRFTIEKQYFKNSTNILNSTYIKNIAEIDDALSMIKLKKSSGLDLHIKSNNIFENEENIIDRVEMAHMFYFAYIKRDAFVMLLSRNYKCEYFLPAECAIGQSLIDFAVRSIDGIADDLSDMIYSNSMEIRSTVTDKLFKFDFLISRSYENELLTYYDKYLFANIDSKLNLLARRKSNKHHDSENYLSIGKNIEVINKMLNNNYYNSMPLLNAALLMVYSHLEYLSKKDEKGFIRDDLNLLRSEDRVQSETINKLLKQCLSCCDTSRIDTDTEEYYQRNKEIVETLRAILVLLKNRSVIYESIFTKEKCVEFAEPIIRVEKIFKEVLLKYLRMWEYDEKTKVTSNWLLCWFGIQLLESNALNDYLYNNIYPPEMTRIFLRRFTSYFLFLFHCIRNYGDPARTHYSDDSTSEVTIAHIYMIVEYAHIDCEVDRKIDLLGMLKEMWSMEAAHYTVTGSGYREHLNHSINCCLFGFMLLKSKHKYKDIFLDTFIAKYLDGMDRPKYYRRWFFTSLLHDIGYSLNLVKSPLKLVEDNYRTGIINEYIHTIKDSIKSAEKELCNGIDKEFEKNSILIKYNKDKINHSVISYVHLIALLEMHHNDIDDHRTPLSSILKHDIDDIKVNSKAEPLVFLLVLCDLLQEWDRPRVDSSIFRQEVAANLLRPDVRDFESQNVLEGICINATLDDNYDMVINHKDGKVVFELVYKNAKETNVEPVLTWLDASASLKRLENIPEHLNIKIVMRHPIQDDLKSLGFNEKDMFYDFVNAKKADSTAQIIPWIEAVNKSACGLTYMYDKTKRDEIFSVDIRELSDAKLDIKAPDNLFKIYTDWKKDFIRTAKLKKVR